MEVQVVVKRFGRNEKRLIVEEPRPQNDSRIYIRGETVKYDSMRLPSHSSVGRHGKRPSSY